jgi:putative membrane protein
MQPGRRCRFAIAAMKEDPQMRQVRTLLVAAALGLGACAGQGNPSLSATDNNFIMQAATGGMGEVALGQMAQRYSSNPSVKEFAEHMVQDHTAANQELMTIARRKGVTPPTTLDPGRVNANRQLSMLNGAAFDQQYMLQQVQDHELQLALFRQQAQSSADPELKAFATKYLPVVQAHTVAAKQVLDSVSLPSAPVTPAAPMRR